LIRDRVFGGREYTADGLRNSYVSMVESGVANDLPGLLENCKGGSRAGAATDRAVSAAIARLPIRREERECISATLTSAVDRELDRLRYDEPEACEQLDARGQAGWVRDAAVAKLVAGLEAKLAVLPKYSEALQAQREIRARAKAEVDPREAWLTCQAPEEPAPEACYQRALSSQYQAAMASLRSSKPAWAEIISLEEGFFLDDHPRESAGASALAFFQSIYGGAAYFAARAGEERMDRCIAAARAKVGSDAAEAIARAERDLVTEPFTGKMLFVDARILNCMNVDYQSDIDRVREAWSARLGVGLRDPRARAIVDGWLLSAWVEAAQKRFAAAP